VTLFASLGLGFTLNRVSLFALIFSIGILVDDAIVVVENIHRHMPFAAPMAASALRGHPACGGRSGRADHPRHVHRDRRAAADGLRVRADGAVHAADPDQCLGRHAAVAADRAGRDALAVAEAAAPRRRRRRRPCGQEAQPPAPVASHVPKPDVAVPRGERRRSQARLLFGVDGRAGAAGGIAGGAASRWC
jgi:hypothetical protein